MHETVRILILGDSDTAEMRPIVADLPQSTADSVIETQVITHLENALSFAAAETWHPDLIIVCQNWPDEFPPRDVSRLLEAFPLARLVGCFGAWCESDGRNRTIWPLSVRIPARCAHARIWHELAVVRGDHPALPLTAGRDEIFEFDHGTDMIAALHSDSPRPIRVHSPDGELRAWLRATLLAHGYRIAEHSETPAAIVWDADPWNSKAEAALREIAGTVPIIALMGFARPEDAAALAREGVTVTAKLAPPSDLLQKLKDCLRQTQPSL